MKRIFITIYILLIGTLFTIPFGLGPIIDALFEKEITRTERDIARGTFSLVAERLEGLGPEDQQAELEGLRPRFGYPLNLYHITDVAVEKKAQADLLKGLIVETDDENTMVMRLGASDQVLAMGGPFPGNELEFKATVLFLFLFVLALTVPALGWTFFLNRDIRKIEKSTACFASGDHGVRVSVSKISSMTGIAKAFNAMAGKVQKLIASQKDLANSVSHEIRTPLARIKFSLEMAGDGPSRNGTDYIHEIGRDVEEIESLVDEMLTYARFEREPESSGDLPGHEMVSWLDSLADRERKTSGEKEVLFTPGLDCIVARFEPVYLGWAVRNLLRNGIKHSSSKVVLGVEPGRSHILIHVDDDGPGIPETAREKIFEPFFRLDQSRSRASGGYGLGLAIAKRIINWHKGNVTATAGPMGGARFTLVLPLDPVDRDVSPEKENPAQA